MSSKTKERIIIIRYFACQLISNQRKKSLHNLYQHFTFDIIFTVKVVQSKSRSRNLISITIELLVPNKIFSIIVILHERIKVLSKF